MRIFRRKRSRRKFRLTREGRAFLFVTLGVGLAAVNTANNLLYLVLGLLLSLLLVSGVLSDLALWKLRMQRKLPGQMFAGRRAIIEMTGFNDKRWLASVSVEAVDEVDGGQAEPARFLRVPPEDSAGATYGVQAKSRGLIEFGSVRVLTRYPFGLIEKGYTVFLPDEIVVYPALLDSAPTPPFAQMPGDAAPMHRTGRGTDFAGSVRYYRDGDESRDIHWTRTATRGELVVRERDQDLSLFVTLSVDNARPSGLSEEELGVWRDALEHSISEVATSTAGYLAQGVSVQVRAADEASPLVLGGAPPDPIWRFLALLKPFVASAPPKSREKAA
ncbi:MAG: DUF58 domain-containing protein [Polyangiales bacterium]